ncbi:YfcE family phosphodiesterase [Saccharibacillus sp. O16]|nr:YfcE family phosphodiesterase [Saccharibacillus sp. O16]
MSRQRAADEIRTIQFSELQFSKARSSSVQSSKEQVRSEAAEVQAEPVIQIAVVSDTHMFRMAKELPPVLIEELSAGVDLILHAGDWTAPEVYDRLAAYAPVEGVAGNNDGAAIAERWGFHRIIEIGGRRIGLTHGHLGRGGTENNALAAFAEEDVEIIVFGHSHIPVSKWVERAHPASPVQLFNPGSPTDKRRQERYSYGIITLTAEVMTFEHRYMDSKR